MSLFFRVLSRLLPDALPWRIVAEKQLRKFFEGLAETPEDVKEFADEVLLDAFPETTRQLSEWERQFGLRQGTSDEARRLAIDTAWKSTGGQSPRYLQDILRAAGFDVYVHEWWSSGPPYVARDPRDYTAQPITGSFQCFDGPGAPECFDGPGAPYCNNFLANDPGYLVNLDLTKRAPPPVPADSSKWPYFIYIGAETFPNRAEVPDWRRSELEALVLKLKPAQQWVVMLVDYVGSQVLVDRDDNQILVEDATDEVLVYLGTPEPVPPFDPNDYAILSWLNLDGSESYEPGTDRIQSVPDAGSAGGEYAQATSGDRPEGVQFDEGKALLTGHHGTAATRLASSAAAGEFTPLHDATADAVVAIVVRLVSFPSSTSQLLGTRSTGNDVGFALRVLDDGTLQAVIGDGASATTIASSPGAVVLGQTHVILAGKRGDELTLRVDGAVVASGTITTPSNDPPVSSMVVGSRPDGGDPANMFATGPFVFAGGPLPFAAELGEYLSQFPMSMDLTAKSVALWFESDDPNATLESPPGEDFDLGASFPNIGAVGTELAQPNSALRPIIPHGPVRAAFFNDSRHLLSDAPAADWAWLHDDTSDALIVFRARRLTGASDAILSTSSFNSSNIGFSVRLVSSGRLQFGVFDGSGSALLSPTSPTNAFPDDATATVAMLKQGATWSVFLDGAQVLSGTLSGPASASDPQRTLMLGYDAAGLNTWIPGVLIFGGPAGANIPPRQVVEAHLQRWDLSGLTDPNP